MSPITTGTTGHQWTVDCSEPKESMETKFKVGDRVEVLKYAEYKGLTGTVTGYEKEEPARAIIRPDNGKWKEVYFFDEYLVPIDSPIHVFKVGDRVKGLRDWIDYGHGLVTKIFNESDWVGVRFDSFEGYGSANDCHRIWPANLQSIYTSPQQTNQTNKPKEQDMKPYAVIYQNLGVSESAQINSYYTTEAEAKEAAEVLVAGQRADLTRKRYFTVTILNTKTGELVGSVTDAPPVVDWNAKK